MGYFLKREGFTLIKEHQHSTPLLISTPVVPITILLPYTYRIRTYVPIRMSYDTHKYVTPTTTNPTGFPNAANIKPVNKQTIGVMSLIVLINFVICLILFMSLIYEMLLWCLCPWVL